MKKLAIIAILFACSGVLFAQTDSEDYYKQQIKERKEMQKYSKKVMKAKLSKEAKKNAKGLKKEGWKPFPGTATLESQINESFIYKNLLEGTLPKYIMGEGSATSTIRDIATKSAETSARARIAEQFQAEITVLIEQGGSGLITSQDAEAMLKIVSESKTFVQQKLRFVRPVVQMYRELPDGKVEVDVTMYTETNQSKNALLEKVEAQSKELREKLERLLGTIE